LTDHAAFPIWIDQMVEGSQPRVEISDVLVHILQV
jgi:hypothetical protein